MYEFVALDFETANEKRASACSVGLVKVNQDGDIVDTFHSLLKPHPDYSGFSPINIWVHGITEEDVADAPTWDEIYPEVRSFIGDFPIVAHNMSFDGYVLSDLAKVYEHEDLKNRRFCTVRLARRILPQLDNRRLPTVLNHYFPTLMFQHHQVLEDAIACAKIFARMQQDYSYEELEALCPQTGPGALSRKLQRGQTASQGITDPRLREVFEKLTNGSGNLKPLTGHAVAFTGKNILGQRSEYQILVEKLGGKAESSVTKKTTILVFGIPNPASWKTTAGSSKLLKATKLREEGTGIEVMSEADFIHFLEAEVEAG